MNPEPVQAGVVLVAMVGLDAQLDDPEGAPRKFRPRGVVHREVLQGGAIVLVHVTAQLDRVGVVLGGQALIRSGKNKLI